MYVVYITDFRSEAGVIKTGFASNVTKYRDQEGDSNDALEQELCWCKFWLLRRTF